MTEMPDFIRRALEAQGKYDPAEIAAKADPAAVPPDAVEVERQMEEADWREAVAPEEKQEEAVREQPALFGDAPVQISYENLLNPTDVATYKRVKAATMRIADEARALAAAAVNGTIGDVNGRSGKQFILTGRGVFRLATSNQSDNSTEVAAHERMGVETIHLSEPEQMIDWFSRHGLDGRLAYDRLVRDMKSRFRT